MLLSAVQLTWAQNPNPNPGIEVAKMQFQAKQVIPPSPDASQLGKYGNVPVSLFTGTPEISIPLEEMGDHILPLSISLRYDASGFKPGEAAPWVGSGWSLNAGGVITRSVMGNPDNESNYFGVSSVLDPPAYGDMFAQYTYMKNIQSATIETQPDVYYYNFAGHTGKFELKPDLTVVKKEKDQMIITPCITGNCTSSKFTIVDEEGNTYIFDQVETTTMRPNDEAGQPSGVTYTFVSAWYLTTMYSAGSEDEYQFDYYSTANPQILYQNLLDNRSVSLTYGCKTVPEPECGPESVLDLNGSTYVPPLVSIKRKFLKKITFKKFGTPVAYLDLESATGRLDSNFPEDRMLNQLKLFSTGMGPDKLVDQYQFNYGYFENLSNTTYKRRLRLDSIQKISVDSITPSPPSYIFTYNTNFSLPELVTASLDHWGYYNASGNVSLVPYVFFPGIVTAGGCSIPSLNIGDGANREASLDGSSASLINKIQYPTGGYTTFEYELNKAKFDDNSIHAMGGVRIKRIVDYSFTDKRAVAKTYSYLLDDGTTSGKAGRFPDYRINSSYHHFKEPYQLCVSGDDDNSCCSFYREHEDYTLYTISVSANSIYGLGSFQGSPVGYSQVTETQTDLSNGKSLGKTVYKYHTGQYFEYDDDITAGDLIQKSVYRNDDKLLDESTSTYQYFVNYDIVGQLVKGKEDQNNKAKYCRSSDGSYIPYGPWETPSSSCLEFRYYYTLLYLTNYSFKTQNKQLIQQTEKIYDQLSDSYLTTTKKFTYGNPDHNYPTLIEETSSKGDKIFTSIKYASDYTGPFSTTPGTISYIIHQCQQRNFQGLPIEKLQYRQDGGGGNKRYINGQITDYIGESPWHIYFLEARPLLTSVTASTISSGDFLMDSHYRLAATMDYDNLLNLTDQSKTGDVPRSYVWDYHQSYPIAEATGATSSQIAYTSFESDNKGGFSFSGTPVEGAAPSGRKYYVLTGSPITGPTNPSLSYYISYWRNSNAGPFTVTGSTHFLKGATKNGWTYYEHSLALGSTVSISGNGNIDELRLYPTSAQMITRTYDPLIGVTSEADANSHMVYYHYDGLSRLSYIKDDDGNIVKDFRYNYGPGTAPPASPQTLFYSVELQTDFTKSGCPVGTHGDVIQYRVPYGKYASALNQADADSKAQSEMTANGQANANSTGLCRWYNVLATKKVVKNDCLPEQGLGLFVIYTVDVGTFKSAVSQADADAMAQADIAANSQAYANSHAACSCGAEGQRVVSGICETGTRINNGSTLQPDGQWKCSYSYVFSDGYVSGPYYSYGPTMCPINP